MKTKQSVVLVSASALAAGMAQGSVIYSGPLSLQQNDDATARQPVDMNGDGVSDFTFGYEFGALKPYIDARTSVSTEIPVQSGMVSILGKSNKGLPVTPAGAMIGLSYASTYPVISGNRGYFFHDDQDALVGDWSGTAINEGYVGIELSPGDGTHYGWLHFIDNPTANPVNLTLVDWAYESTPGLDIGTAVIPEPSTGALAGVGLAAALMLRKRRQSV
jgi:hypothetical protein